MQHFWLFLIGSIWITNVCHAAPQGEADAAEGGEEASGEPVNLDELKEMMTFLKMEVKMPLEMIVQDRLFQPKKVLRQTVQEVMTAVLELRKKVLERIKAIRAGSIEVNPQLNIKQEAFLIELRKHIMDVLLMLVEQDADNLDSLQAVGKALLDIRVKIVAKNMELIMLRDGQSNRSNSPCDCEPFDGLSEAINAEAVKEAGGGEALEKAKVVEHLNMQLMTVDSSVEMKYMDILQEDDEDKRKELEDGLRNLKDVSNCLNEVMLEISGLPEEDPENEKLTRIVDRQLNGCTTLVKRQLKQCQENCPTGASCDSCGADLIDEIVTKLKDWEEIIALAEEGDDGKREDIRDEALTYLNNLDQMMTKLLTNKISQTTEDEEEQKCEKEKLDVLSTSKNPMWMLVNVTIFGDDALVQEMIAALIEAKQEMRKQYCTEVDEPGAPVESCDVDEITTAKEWTTTIDALITEQIFVDKPNAVDVMLEIVKIKGTMEARVQELFKDGLKCKEEVEQIKNVYNDQITQCLTEMMEPNYDFENLERHLRVDCMKQLRNKVEERRGMLWMRELMKKIQEQESSGEDYQDYPDEGK